MIQKIYKYIQKNKLITEGDTVLVGVSGGADSVCLLCVLWELYQNGNKQKQFSNVSIRAIHINHQLRDTAVRDQKYTEKLCQKLQIPLTVVSVDVAAYEIEHHVSTEEAARILRYEAFYNALEDVPEEKRKIAVAHNMNDSAETVLFNLFRGSGLRGLGGIPKARGEIIRPLLCVTRNEIENHLKEKNMEFCIDETNLTDEYSRNCIRHHILPAAEEMVHGGVVKRINETARGLSAAEDYILGEIKKAEKKYIKIDMYSSLDSETGEDGFHNHYSESMNQEIGEEFDSCFPERLILQSAKEELHSYLLERLILEQLAVFCGTARDISSIHVSQIVELFELQVGKQISLPYGCIARRVYKGILICKKKSKKAIDRITPEIYLEELELDNLRRIMIHNAEFICRIFPFDGDRKKIPHEKYTKWFDYDKINNSVCFRTRKSGDYLIIDENDARKTLKAYFINEKIPREKRDEIIVAADGSHILWAVGYRTSIGCNVSDKTKTILEIRYEE